MENKIVSELMGVFVYDELCKEYEQHEGKIHWSLDISDEGADLSEMIKRAEKLFVCIEEFDKKAKASIAEELIDYKNDVYHDYDEDDENLDWDAVDAGEYDITKEEFEEAIILYDVIINANGIYCEYYDGDLFGGHRIHSYFNNDYKFLSADV